MKKGTTLRFLAGIFTAAIAAPTINAQHAPIDFDESETIVLPTFTVESETVDRYRSADAVSAVRIRTSLIETPVTISVLTREFLEDVAPVRILDATRYSASVQSGYHQTFVDTMTVRGFGVGGRTVDNFFDDVGYLVEPTTIERIEISKGPNALLSPGGSPGGHINSRFIGGSAWPETYSRSWFLTAQSKRNAKMECLKLQGSDWLGAVNYLVQ